MALYQNILLAVDLHPSCDKRITQRAVDMAKLYHAKLTIVHAVEHLMVYGPAMVYMGDIERQILDDAKKSLDKLARKFNIPPKRQIVEMGAPKFIILEQAKKLKSDLIIIGSHGRHGVGLLLGATANAILNQAPCDVTVIRVKK